MRYLIIELFEKMYHGKLQNLVWDAMLVPSLAQSDGHQHGDRKPAKTSGVYLGYFKAFLLSAELSHIDIDAFYYMLADQTSKKHKASRFFHVRDMFRAAILLSRTAQKSKIQTALFSKQRVLSC